MTVRGRLPQPKCTATSKRSGEQCKNYAVIGTHVCRLHGAKTSLTKRGAASPHFKTGKSGKYSGHALAGEMYRRALADPGLLTNRHEIAMLESLIHQTGTDAAGLFDAPRWKQVTDQCQIGLQTDNAQHQVDAFTAIEDIARRGLEAPAKVKALREMFLERARLVESQTKIEVQAGLTMNAEQVTGFVMTIAQAINDNVKDVRERDAVQAHLMRILGSPID